MNDFWHMKTEKEKHTPVHQLVAPKHTDPFVDLHTYIAEFAVPQFPPIPLYNKQDL